MFLAVFASFQKKIAITNLPLIGPAIIPKSHIIRFCQLLLQFLLLIALVKVCNIEEQQGFLTLLLILLPTFILHSFLPLSFRPAFLVLIFATSCLFLLGWVSGGFILVVSLLIFLLLSLRIPKWVKIFGITVIVVGLVLLRTQLFFAPRAIIATPYIAALFMFRLISYIQFERNKEKPAPFFQRLSYFMLLPNLTFLIFPIIDYRNYIRLYYTRPALEIYQKGLNRVFTGVFLLMIYRLVYTSFSVPADAINSASSFLAYISVNYFLIIRIAGILQISLGLVTMFGYDLPPVFENFFLATGFSDLWRRVNIYWRDFIIKTFYFPLYFRLRIYGQYIGMFTAGIIAFFFSWMLHAYQLFWITGSFNLRLTDMIYWMTMGIFITLDGMAQYSHFRPKKKRKNWDKYVGKGIRITLIFLYAAILWSIWNAESLSAWAFLLHKITFDTQDAWLITLAFVTAVLITGLISAHLTRATDSKAIIKFTKKTINCAAATAMLIFFVIANYMPAGSQWSIFAEELGKQRINNEDRELIDEGYYGQLLGSGAMAVREKGFGLLGDIRWGSADGAMHRTGDIYLRVFNPNIRVKHYNFHMVTNSIGLRDREYSPIKPAGIQRWIFLGGSYVTGFGVEMDNTFEARVERTLNDSLTREKKGGLEIINYSSFGYGLVQQVALCRDKIFRFDPDAVFYFAHPDEERYCAQMISKFVILGIDLSKYAELASILKRAKVKQTQSRTEIIARLRPFSKEVVNWGYNEIASLCYRRSAVPVWVFLPTTTDTKMAKRYQYLQKIASRAGFTCLNLSEVFNQRKLTQIQGGGIDTHPSVFGHRLISEILEQEIRKNPRLLQSRSQ